jgi:hypothetical protein
MQDAKHRAARHVADDVGYSAGGKTRSGEIENALVSFLELIILAGSRRHDVGLSRPRFGEGIIKRLALGRCKWRFFTASPLLAHAAHYLQPDRIARSERGDRDAMSAGLRDSTAFAAQAVWYWKNHI